MSEQIRLAARDRRIAIGDVLEPFSDETHGIVKHEYPGCVGERRPRSTSTMSPSWSVRMAGNQGGKQPYAIGRSSPVPSVTSMSRWIPMEACPEVLLLHPHQACADGLRWHPDRPVRISRYATAAKCCGLSRYREGKRIKSSIERDCNCGQSGSHWRFHSRGRAEPQIVRARG